MEWIELIGPALPKYVALLFSLCVHEYAHGYVALLRGDDTARLMGRLTLNPIAHAELLGTVVFPLIALMTPAGFLFGWAKPVPVDPRQLKNRRVDLFWIAFAGPLSNIILALLGTLLLKVILPLVYGTTYLAFVVKFLSFFIAINFVLAFFNLIPIHPLDGGKVLARFLPEKINNTLEQHEGMLQIFLLLLLFSGSLSYVLTPAVRMAHGLSVWALGGY